MDLHCSVWLVPTTALRMLQSCGGKEEHLANSIGWCFILSRLFQHVALWGLEFLLLNSKVEFLFIINCIDLLCSENAKAVEPTGDPVKMNSANYEEDFKNV